MPRRKTADLARKKNPDQYFQSVNIEILNRAIVQHGKYQLACRIVKSSLDGVFDTLVKKGLYKTFAAPVAEKTERKYGRYEKAQSVAGEENHEHDLNAIDRREAIRLVFDDVLERAAPELELISKRIGGANIQVPVVVKHDRKTVLAIRTIIKNARKRKGKEAKSMADALAREILDTIKGSSQTLIDKEIMLKMARANAVYSGTRR